MAFSFDCFVITHIGNRRDNNEDNFLAGGILMPAEQAVMSGTTNKYVSRSFVASGAENNILAVSDGMGGHEFGEVASFMIVNALSGFVSQYKNKPSRKRNEKYEYIQDFQKLVKRTNRDILDYAADNNASENMGATMSGLITFPDEAAPVNVGDSSTFLFEDGKLVKLTTDDNEKTLFNGISSSGLKANGQRLTKYFGLPESWGILTATISAPIPLRLGQIFIIATDGLTDYLTPDDISGILTQYPDSIELSVNVLVGAALDGINGGRDNITVAAIKVIKTPDFKEDKYNGRK